MANVFKAVNEKKGNCAFISRDNSDTSGILISVDTWNELSEKAQAYDKIQHPSWFAKDGESMLDQAIIEADAGEISILDMDAELKELKAL